MYKMGRGNRQDNIKKSDVTRIPIPIIPINHQNLLIKSFDEFFQKKKQIFEIVNNVMSNYEKLKQSILISAFEGKLVSQNPKDKPATFLLEEIQKIKKTSK